MPVWTLWTHGSDRQPGRRREAALAKLKQAQSIETINLDEAMDYSGCRATCQFEEQDVTVSIGRFGPYIAHDKNLFSAKNSIL